MNEEIKSIESRYQAVCLNCSKRVCKGCDLFGKVDAMKLLDEYYKSRHRVAAGVSLGLPDEILVRIFVLHLQGVPKYSIVKTINKEFPRHYKGRSLDWVNWKQVHFVIMEKYKSEDAKVRIAKAKEQAQKQVAL